MFKLLKKTATQAKQVKARRPRRRGSAGRASQGAQDRHLWPHARGQDRLPDDAVAQDARPARLLARDRRFSRPPGHEQLLDLLAAGQWPPPTATERLYRFTAVIDTTIRYPFESQDYQGESVSIDREVETGKGFLEYFESCDAVFVLVDAEDLIVEGREAGVRRRKKIDSFELMLAQLVEGARNRLKIPVAVVITKADLLDGFQGEDQVVLVGDTIRYSRYRGYDSFVAAVLQQPHVSRHLPWRDQVDRRSRC